MLNLEKHYKDSEIDRIAGQLIMKSIKDGSCKLTHEYSLLSKIPTKKNIDYVKSNVQQFKSNQQIETQKDGQQRPGVQSKIAFQKQLEEQRRAALQNAESQIQNMNANQAQKIMAKMMGVKTGDLVNRAIMGAIEIDNENERQKDKRNVGATAMPTIKKKGPSQLPIERVSKNYELSRQIFGERNRAQSIEEH